jgi:hypothetical protein
MKVYATVRSERATKGQGGKTLHVEIMDESKLPVIEFNVKHNGEKTILEGTYKGSQANVYLESEENIARKKKGEKQKGEVIDYPKDMGDPFEYTDASSNNK